MTFKELHYQNKPLIIGNVWGVPSAKVAEKLGIQAIATSSWAVAAILGYEDGENISFSELEYIVKRIAKNTNLPLSVDLESGYSRDPSVIFEHVKRLFDIGVVGINIEDSVADRVRTMLDAKHFAGVVEDVNSRLKQENIDVFLNVRTDAYLLGYANAMEESINRIRLYEEAGADGIFTPCITSEPDIRAVVNSTSLPINVLCMPDLPDFDSLSTLGVQRISMGNFLFDKMYDMYEGAARLMLDEGSFKSVF